MEKIKTFWKEFLDKNCLCLVGTQFCDSQKYVSNVNPKKIENKTHQHVSKWKSGQECFASNSTYFPYVAACSLWTATSVAVAKSDLQFVIKLFVFHFVFYFRQLCFQTNWYLLLQTEKNAFYDVKLTVCHLAKCNMLCRTRVPKIFKSL